MRRKIALAAALLSALWMLAACRPAAEPPASQTNAQSPAAAATPSETRTDSLGRFQTVDLSGKPFDYTMFYANKLTMVNVWATWCPYCVQEMPDLARLSGEYDGKGFAIVGILGDSVKSFDDPVPVRDDAAVASGLQIMQKDGVTYTVLQPDEALCKTLAAIEGFPTTYFVDSKGAVVDTVVGAQSYDDWKSEIDNLLAKVS